MRQKLSLILRDERGATAIEYGLILALIFIAIVAVATSLGGNTTAMWNTVSSRANSAMSNAN